MNDSQAISAILQGDKNRYEELVVRYRKLVYAIAWSHLGDSELSEDAAPCGAPWIASSAVTLTRPGPYSRRRVMKLYLRGLFIGRLTGAS